MKIPNHIEFNWHELVVPDIRSLEPVRDQLHNAVQFIAAAGKYIIESRPDDSHTSMSWDSDLSLFLSEPITSGSGFYIALSPASFELSILDKQKNIIESCSLDQKNREFILMWMKSSLGKLGINIDNLSLKLHYDIPDHPLAHGANFEKGAAKNFTIFSDLYANAAAALRAVRKSIPASSAVRCWPHHFDIATLITLDPEKDSGSARSIGIGMSPGDSSITQPYFYINPWPAPDKSINLPEIKGPASWHTEGWVGVVLPISEIIKCTSQSILVADYIKSGINANLLILGEDK